MSDTQEKLEKIQATKTKSNVTRSGYEITLDPEYLTDLIESAKREADRAARISELDWALSRLNTYGKETDSQALNRATDEIDDNLAQLKQSEEEV